MNYVILYMNRQGYMEFFEVTNKDEAIQVARKNKGVIVEAFEFDIKKTKVQS